MPNPRNIPYENCNFLLEIDGIPSSAFDEIILPELLISAEEFREGNDHGTTSRKIPGRASLTNLILRRGFTGNLDLYNWSYATANGNPGTIKNMRIGLLDEQQNQVASWILHNVFPVRYSFTPLDSLDGSPLIETLELSCERIQMETV